MESISERVSAERSEGGLSVVIGARIGNGRMALLWAWLALWTACGVYFMVELAQAPTGDLRVALMVMLAFWAYFEVRVWRSALWRAKGFELWRVKDGEFTVKNSLFGYGKADRWFTGNISRFGLLNMDEAGWKWLMSDSFWGRGAERIGFEHAAKKVAIGRGLTREGARSLVGVVAEALKRERKAGKA